MEQIKKNPNDPNVEDINPELVNLARHHAFLRQPMELFLTGQLTWLEALETMVLLLTKEYRAQNKMLIEVIKEKPELTMLVGPSGALVKALPPHPLSHEDH